MIPLLRRDGVGRTPGSREGTPLSDSGDCITDSKYFPLTIPLTLLFPVSYQYLCVPSPLSKVGNLPLPKVFLRSNQDSKLGTQTDNTTDLCTSIITDIAT